MNTMKNICNEIDPAAIPVRLFLPDQYTDYHAGLSAPQQQWLHSIGFEATVGRAAMLPDQNGVIAAVACCVRDFDDVDSIRKLVKTLPSGCYRLLTVSCTAQQWQNIAFAWAMSSYQFDRYKTKDKSKACLCLPAEVDADLLNNTVDAYCFSQDLINTPTEDLGPTEFMASCKQFAKTHKAKFSAISGDALLKKGFPLVHAVGRASTQPPCLIDLRWKHASGPSVTLVGKGVCYDTGGLSLKPSNGMLRMKKDMGGAATALALACLIVKQQLPVNLRVILPLVENSVAGNSVRPGDVIRSRSGLTVEITNTDAEGRLILADALTYAQEEPVDYLFDFATLTGAARVALGPDIPSLFCTDSEMAENLQRHAWSAQDFLWQMPLYQPYHQMLKSGIADMVNSANSGYAGSITAALFLQKFIQPSTRWCHIDTHCWAGSPTGPDGQARMQAVRALFAYLRTQV
jgi:leucyl aminopeptidase